VVLLSLGVALAFAAAAHRKGSALSVRAEWSQAIEVRLEEGLSRRLEKLAWQEEERLRRQELEELQKFQERQHNLVAARQEPPAAARHPAGAGRGKDPSRRGGVDASYFEALAGDSEALAGEDKLPPDAGTSERSNTN
jgi:hypothetical protein